MKKKLRAAASRLPSPFAWRAMETVRCVEAQLDQHHKLSVSRESSHAHVLKALGTKRKLTTTCA